MRLAAEGGRVAAAEQRVIPDGAIAVLEHGFVRLDDSMASDLSVVNAARVSFGRRKEEMDESDGYDSHYTPMIKEGIPRAIRWIKQKTGT